MQFPVVCLGERKSGKGNRVIFFWDELEMLAPEKTSRVGVLALQGAFYEHLKLLQDAWKAESSLLGKNWDFIEVRTAQELEQCDALIIPGGESTTMSLVAERSGILEPLRSFVKVHRNPVWGTCAGMILLAEQANRTKKGGQELIGGLDVRINRNHFGRQRESFETNLQLPFISNPDNKFHTIFIRAPIVESVLPPVIMEDESAFAPSKAPKGSVEAAFMSDEVQILAEIPQDVADSVGDAGGVSTNIVAVRQGNVLGISFHPELTTDTRLHQWWLRECVHPALERKRLLMKE